MMKNSNLMTRVALTLLVMMLTATTAWAETKTVKYTLGSYTEKNDVYYVNVSATGVSTTGDVNKNYSLTITEQSNGHDALFAFSPATEFLMRWSSTEARFLFNHSSSKPYFGGSIEGCNWTLTLVCGNQNLYITNVKFYDINDNQIYETNNRSPICEITTSNQQLGGRIHAFEVTITDTPSFNINYELNGGTNAASNPSTYTSGTGVASFANPTRTGYTFGGWYEDSSFSTPVTYIPAYFNIDITLYAKWTANTYTVVYNANGGSGSMSDQSFTYDGQQNLSANTFTYPGKLFDGWNTAANGSGTSYSDGQSVPNVTATNGARVTLYAQWKTAPGYPTGSGTASDPYRISSIDQWNTFANANNYKMFYDSDKHIELGADISGVTTTVGTQAYPFQGTFNGNQKTLTVNINETSTQGTALFREISGATIKNLTVKGSVTGTTHAAALVGFSRSGTNTIEYCNVSANVTVNTGNNKHCGGLVGHAVESTLTIKNCIYSGTISNGGNYAGGLQGWSDGSTLTIENSLFSGSYTGSGLFHPIAVRYRNASMTSNINGAYYTAAPTLTDAAFIVTPGTQAYTEQQFFPCKSATILGTTIYYTNGDFTHFGKTDSYSPDGSAERPFIISNTDGWDYFCEALQDNDTWNRFSGMTVKLGENITVTRMAGSEGHEFCGTFDGDHHTLTVSFNNSEGNAAPFREIRGATIKNLIVCGTIIGKKHSSGLVGYARGEDASVENTIENCLVNTDVSIANSETTGYLGGIVGHGLKSKLTIRGCAFIGSLTSSSNYTGGLQGWSDGNTLILKDDFFAPTRVSAANVGFHPVAIHVNGSTTIATVSNVYYTIAPTCTSTGRIAAQGKQVRSIVAGENVTINHMPTGSSTNYSTSGITAYSSGGIKYGDKFYYGKDDVISLTLSHEDQEGYAFLGYEAKDSQQNAVTLTAAGDNYTLTMPDDDVTVTAKVAMLYSLTLPDGMEVVSADPAAIGGKYKEGTTIQFKIKSEDYVLEGDVKNGDKVLTADADGSYIVKVGNADITITASFIVTLSGDMSYTAQDGDVLRGSTSGTVRIADGASITLSDVTINGGIVCLGTATIILVGTNSVTGPYTKAGIQVGGEGTTLTIKGNGALMANGGYRGAGIGTGFVDGGSVTFGNIIIEGGSITATGDDYGAGIGTGCVYKGNVTLGDITIEGGSITANGGDFAAGIGMGEVLNGGTATLSNITIKGGSITANVGNYGAGIGTGEVLNGGTATLSNITIKGGSITANGGYYGAGIGTGYVVSGSVTLSNITIEGGSIMANGGIYGAGIGTGYVIGGSATLGTLTIYDDIDLVDATGKSKSGIECSIVYMHGETNVTGNASYYFIITHEGKHDVIESIQNKKYTITLVNEEKHGTVTMPAKAKSGESVTITVTPDNGYMLDTIEVKDANGNEVELDEDDMSFIMPDSNVTIRVTWKYVGVKGDVNGNGTVDISDVVALVNAILNDESNDAYDC